MPPSAVKIQRGSFYLAVWGCQMNVYDAARLRDLMQVAGYAEASAPDTADVLILITCAVRAKAENKVFNQLAVWRHRGIITSRTVVALGGCIGAELLRADPPALPAGVTVLFTPATMHLLPELIRERRQAPGPAALRDTPATAKFTALPPPGRRDPAAFVTIMEGCSNGCSYCVVPYTRGPEVSRAPADVLGECRLLLAQGVRELHLLGQNVNSYRGRAPDGGICTFTELLYEVAALPGLERLRFTTSNPMDFSAELIAAFGELEVLADSVHIPVQSGADRILQLMRRRYRADDYRRLVADLRRVRPSLHISSDFIVGFPGETEADFAATLALVNEVRFDQSFSFVYSPRPHTPAALLPDPVPQADKLARLHRLQARLAELEAEYDRALVGTAQTALAEAPSRRSPFQLSGRISCNRTVVFTGKPALIGRMVPLTVTAVRGHTLCGKRR